MSASKRVSHGAGAAPVWAAFEEAVDGLCLVAGDENCLGGVEREGVFYNPVNNDLAAHGQ